MDAVSATGPTAACWRPARPTPRTRCWKQAPAEAVARLVDEEYLLAALNGTAGPQVRAWARVAVARRATDAVPWSFPEALGEAEATVFAAGRDQEQPWPDLVLPDDLLARVCIERGLIAAPEAAVLVEVLRESYATVSPGRHRRRTARVAVGSACGRRSWSRLRSSAGTSSTATSRREWRSARPDDLIPPLCAMRAEAWLAAGYPERALALTDERRSQALTCGDDATVRLADAETVRIVRRMRLDQPSCPAVPASRTAEMPILSGSTCGTVLAGRRTRLLTSASRGELARVVAVPDWKSDRKLAADVVARDDEYRARGRCRA